ncbi:hypothetical protein HELRODRAFT_90077 [Helobdella robusta]|uniref:Sepiapterin reductase n=1 Tax=Helobdella robusta TaxID=6412 RepID=T1G7K9_HELRO|nr:hypothetical protein HELRODRAFT_90077 [Helobdella robusta]AID66632.1 sepiapterin reductase [Helobdella robusta]ESN91994.1 hypothetical protein HELRODRAFT_90077 [Helobdella robusta]
MSSFYHRRTFCLITGASRGFGEGLALKFASKFAPKSVIVLVARNETRLNSVKLKVNSLRSDVLVFTMTADLCDIDGEVFEDNLKAQLKNNNLSSSDFNQCLLLQNAGSAGDLSLRVLQQNDKKLLDEYWSLNLTSALIINSLFFSIFTNLQTKHRYVVQISSLLAIKPFKSWGLYCAAKAARDMIFSVISKEEPDIRVLSYAPGPLQTDMFQQAMDEIADVDTLAVFKGLWESAKSVLSCEQSAEKLSMLLHFDVFQSGSHVDYYEVNDCGEITSTN